MKILMIYCSTFEYLPTNKTLEYVAHTEEGKSYIDIQTAFIQAEEKDVEQFSEVAKKLVKNLKWIMKKNNATKLLLHSFAHLSESKADPKVTMQFFDYAEEKIKSVGYEVHQTPFGYFLDLKIDAPGLSLARVFKDI